MMKKKYILCSICILCVIVIVFINIILKLNMANSVISDRNEEEFKSIEIVDWKDILTEYEKDKEIANSKYLDKYVKVKILIDENMTLEGEVDGFVSLIISQGKYNLEIVSSSNNISKELKLLKIGDNITVDGICNGELSDFTIVIDIDDIVVN